MANDVVLTLQERERGELSLFDEIALLASQLFSFNGIDSNLKGGGAAAQSSQSHLDR